MVSIVPEGLRLVLGLWLWCDYESACRTSMCFMIWVSYHRIQHIQQISIKIIYCTITQRVCLTLTLWAISCTILLHIWLPLLCFYAFMLLCLCHVRLLHL